VRHLVPWIVVFTSVWLACANTEHCYSACPSTSAVGASCNALGQDAGCGSTAVQSYNGSGNVNGLCLVYGADGGCLQPTTDCAFQGCKEPVDCTQVPSCGT
jgi:hypothetical protein